MESKASPAMAAAYAAVFISEGGRCDVNPYTCDECPWEYDWTMGDRVRAVKRHQLAHLIDQREKKAPAEEEVPAYRLPEYVAQRLRTVRWL